MKSVREEKNTFLEIDTFPCLGESLVNDTVVLFTQESVGIVMYSGSEFDKLGKFDTSWVMRQFKPYLKTIKISNN